MQTENVTDAGRTVLGCTGCGGVEEAVHGFTRDKRGLKTPSNLPCVGISWCVLCAWMFPPRMRSGCGAMHTFTLSVVKSSSEAACSVLLGRGQWAALEGSNWLHPFLSSPGEGSMGWKEPLEHCEDGMDVVGCAIQRMGHPRATELGKRLKYNFNFIYLYINKKQIPLWLGVFCFLAGGIEQLGKTSSEPEMIQNCGLQCCAG